MPQKLVPPSRGLKTENRYCGRLDDVLNASEGGTSAGSANLDQSAASVGQGITSVYVHKSQ